MIKRFGPRPDPRRTYIRRFGAYAVLPRAGSLLLTEQAAEPPDLQLPGGGVDPGESPVRALHREVYEETGWTISAPRRLGAFRRFVFMPEYDIWAEKVCAIYLAQPVQRLVPPIEPDHRVVWMPPHEAVRALGNAGDRHFAARAFGL